MTEKEFSVYNSIFLFVFIEYGGIILKIGVIGPSVTSNVIRETVEKELPDISLTIYCSEHY